MRTILPGAVCIAWNVGVAVPKGKLKGGHNHRIILLSQSRDNELEFGWNEKKISFAKVCKKLS